MSVIETGSRINGLLFVLAVAIFSFVVWAQNAEITQHVKGQGRIIPSGKIRHIQHFEGGIIRAILVEEGDQINEGDVLFEIENVAAHADLNEARIRQDQLEIRLQRLKAEREEYRPLIFAGALEEKYPEIISSETALFESNKEGFEKAISVLLDQIEQKRLKISSLENTRKNLTAELFTANKQFELTDKLVRAGSASQREHLDAESRLKNFQTRISQIEKEIPVLLAEKKEAENKLVQVRRERESEIIEKISQASFEARQVAERLGSYDDVVSRSKIVAPVRGIMNTRYVNTVGGVIGPGGIVADIMPIEEQLIAEGQVAAKDRAKIYIGLPVKIRLNAYDFRRTNAIDGKLEHISADSVTSEDGKAYYRVRVSIQHDRIPGGIKIFSGMVVDLLISADRISVLRAIMKPFLDVTDNAFREV